MGFSYSMVDQAARCLHKYKRIYVDKLELPPSGDMAFGSAMHAALNAVLLGEDGVGTFKIIWDIEKSKGREYAGQDWDEYLDLGPAFIERFSRLHAKKFEPHTMEQRLYGRLPNNIEIEGTPDYIGLYNGKKAIVDYKTAAYAYPKGKLLTSVQLHLYAELAKQALDYEAEILVYKVLVKRPAPRIQTLVLPFSKTRHQKLMYGFIDQVEDLASRKTFPRNCSSCIIGQNKCDLFQECHGDENVVQTE